MRNALNIADGRRWGISPRPENKAGLTITLLITFINALLRMTSHNSGLWRPHIALQ
ncbi:hypothetical protein KCP75_16875 [Salmonella enterica subsp. enterica]|nr:hypothetical protein KCP75_16875 [Salmonella enterica subsp. enterica]